MSRYAAGLMQPHSHAGVPPELPVSLTCSAHISEFCSPLTTGRSPESYVYLATGELNAPQPPLRARSNNKARQGAAHVGIC